MKQQERGILLVSGLLAAGALSLAALSLAALQGRPLPLGAATLRLSTGEDLRAKQVLDTGASREQFDRAEADVRRAIALSPYNNTARLRMAWIDAQRTGRLGPGGVRLFAQSYDLAPYDVAVAKWRIPFALENWKAIPPNTRANVRVEALAFGRDGSRMADVRTSLRAVQNPSGRVSAALWQRRLKVERKLRQAASAPPTQP